MSEQYRVPGDANMGHWPEWAGEGVPPEPYLRREIRVLDAPEEHPRFLDGAQVSPPWGTEPPIVLDVGTKKVVWVLYGDHWVSTLAQRPGVRMTEWTAFDKDYAPEVEA